MFNWRSEILVALKQAILDLIIILIGKGAWTYDVNKPVWTGLDLEKLLEDDLIDSRCQRTPEDGEARRDILLQKVCCFRPAQRTGQNNCGNNGEDLDVRLPAFRMVISSFR